MELDMPGKSLRPKMRPDGLKMRPGDEMSSNRAAVRDAIEPMSSARPKKRPKYMEEEAGAVARGRDAYAREMEDMPQKYADGGSVRGKSRAERKKRSASYNPTPEMPEEKGNDGFSRGKAFQPGVGGAWSAPVGKRRTRIMESGAEEKNRTMSDNYGQGTPRAPKEFRDGGMVRGCKSSQMSGKGFRGTY